MGKLDGKVAVVTGASKGIGAGIARRLAAEGASVVVNYASSKEGADRVVAEIEGKGGRAVAIQGDVAKAGEVKRLFALTKEAFGRLDVLVNNAGVFEFAPLEAITEEHFHRQFNINVLGLILASQEAAAAFGPDGGSIINVSSMVSYSPPAGASVYSGTKGAVDAISASLARELASRKIRVNSVNPGMVETEGVHTAGFLGTDFSERMIAQTPLGRVGQPDDIAKAVVFLATDDAGWVTGSTLPVAGGWPSY